MNHFTIDKHSPIPYYYQIEEWLRGLIASGQLKPGDMLADEITLAGQLNISRMTMRHALNHLANEGLLTRQRGRGTFVAPPRSQVPFVRDQIRSMTEEVAAEGHALRSRVLAQALLPASAEMVRELGLPLGDQMILIRRLRSTEGVPLAIENAHHPHRRFPELLTRDLTDRSIYEILEEEYDARPTEAVDTIVAGTATREEAALLEVEEGAPVMRYKRISRDASGGPLEFTTAIIRADRYQFVIRYKKAVGN